MEDGDKIDSTCCIQSAWGATGEAKSDEVGWATVCCWVTDIWVWVIIKQGIPKLTMGNRILDYEGRAAI